MTETKPMTVGELRILDEWPVKGGKRHYKVLCFCGKEFIVRKDSIQRKNTKSCGCLNFNKPGGQARKHMHTPHINGKTTHSPTYSSWNSMKNRCTNSNHKHFHRYGGRGIKVCERWINSFVNFLEDMGSMPEKGYSIDRIDNDGNYELSNCRWITRSENARRAHLGRKRSI